jgi:hypothetical protein
MEQLRDRMSSTDPRESFWVERQRLASKSPLVIDKQLPTVVQRLYETVIIAENEHNSQIEIKTPKNYFFNSQSSISIQKDSITG